MLILLDTICILYESRQQGTGIGEDWSIKKTKLENFRTEPIMQEHLVSTKSGISTPFSNHLVTLGWKRALNRCHQCQK